MRIGLLADIHEAVEPLAAAIRRLSARRVDAFVILGDILDQGERVDETIALLSPLPGGGVWGNHDLGLCGEVYQSVRDQFSAATLDYFARLRPSATFGSARFQHIDPHLNPEQLEDLWSFPTNAERIEGFAKCPHARVFVGHLHCWGIFTPERQITWGGEDAFQYQVGERYLTVVHAVKHGWCALFDSERDVLEPVRAV